MAMSDDTKEPTAGDLLKNSTLYREFQAEREEILKHKWIESEKAGHDIGFIDWMRLDEHRRQGLRLRGQRNAQRNGAGQRGKQGPPAWQAQATGKSGSAILNHVYKHILMDA